MNGQYVTRYNDRLNNYKSSWASASFTKLLWLVWRWHIVYMLIFHLDLIFKTCLLFHLIINQFHLSHKKVKYFSLVVPLLIKLYYVNLFAKVNWQFFLSHTCTLLSFFLNILIPLHELISVFEKKYNFNKFFKKIKSKKIVRRSSKCNQVKE